ncbi:hypothetical protein HMPREF3229_00288 [Peptoniphilus harei]|uniref:Uncharacterized protein n=1 Tax=Peptoniphilus harei TaxID=54005 RepID=A0A133PRX0_9FIRM|nr:hypothetical protein HMPREF3229_00288 [Peptoniphilus harei]
MKNKDFVKSFEVINNDDFIKNYGVIKLSGFTKNQSIEFFRQRKKTSFDI